ncbi:hypothetical protein AAII07_00990 [Microvirga sp. 0TCS3.31]
MKRAYDDRVPATVRPGYVHWPGVLGLVVAAWQVVAGASVEGTAITVAAAASCYLAAAAVGRRWAAWAGVVAASAVVVLSELAGAPWWVGLLGYATVLVAVGLARPATRRASAEQGLALAGFGGLAVITLSGESPIWPAVAGLTLASHALWDLRHWRRDDVVPRSMAEFCILLDVPLGGAAILVALAG